jgi:fluoride exporter
VRVWLAVAIGGALGALARWFVGEWILAWSGPAAVFPWGTFPWGTLTVNVVGCALIGFLAPVVITRSPWVAGFVVTGFLGGFTTYSAFAEEAFVLADRGDAAGVVLAGIYVLATIATTAAAVALGSRLSPGNQQAVAR